MPAFDDGGFEFARPLLDLAFELVDHGGAGFGEDARRPLLGRGELAVEQFFAIGAVFVLELLAPNLREDARAQHFEFAGFGDVVVGAGAQPFEHGVAVVMRGQKDQRDVAHAGRGLDPDAGFLAAHARHDEVHQDAVDRLHREQIQRLLARARQRHFIAFGPQRRGELVEIGEAVVHGENLARSAEAGDRLDRPVGEPAHHRRQPRQDDVHVVVLAHEGVGPGLEGTELRPTLLRCRQQHAGQGPHRRIEAHAADQRRAVHVRHHAVDDHRIGPPVGDHRQPRLAVLGGQHAIARILEDLGQPAPVGFAVVDDQDRRLGVGTDSRRAEQVAPLGHHIHRIIGLADIFIGAGNEATNAILHLGLGRQHQHRQRPALIGTQFLEQIDAVAIGQDHVEHHQPDVVLVEGTARLGQGRGRLGAHARRLEGLDQIHADGEAVIDDEYGADHGKSPRGRTRLASAGPISPSGRIRAAPPLAAASRGIP